MVVPGAGSALPTDKPTTRSAKAPQRVPAARDGILDATGRSSIDMGPPSGAATFPGADPRHDRHGGDGKARGSRSVPSEGETPLVLGDMGPRRRQGPDDPRRQEAAARVERDGRGVPVRDVEEHPAEAGPAGPADDGADEGPSDSPSPGPGRHPHREQPGGPGLPVVGGPRGESDVPAVRDGHEGGDAGILEPPPPVDEGAGLVLREGRPERVPSVRESPEPDRPDPLPLPRPHPLDRQTGAPATF